MREAQRRFCRATLLLFVVLCYTGADLKDPSCCVFLLQTTRFSLRLLDARRLLSKQAANSLTPSSPHRATCENKKKMLAFLIQWSASTVRHRGDFRDAYVSERRARGRTEGYMGSARRRRNRAIVRGSTTAAWTKTTPTTTTMTTTTTTTTTSAVVRTADGVGVGVQVGEMVNDEKKKKNERERYQVRVAELCELYTVADIRCEAFYGAPRNANYFAVRRREIFVAMRGRVAQGNQCLVVVDGENREEEGGEVVASCDVAFHAGVRGVRMELERKRGSGGSIYVSSMAVREGWRGRGLAQRLLGHVDGIVREFGVEQVFLHVEWDNCVAVHVYRKCGFQVVGGGMPKWLGVLAKKEHTLMKKSYDHM